MLGEVKVKKRNHLSFISMLFISIIILLSLSATISLQIDSIDSLSDLSLYSKPEYVLPLARQDYLASSLPKAGVFPNGNNPWRISANILEIEGNPTVIFPGDTITVRNRFNDPAQIGTYAIVSQEIEIFLFEGGTSPTPLTSTPITTAVTNGTRDTGFTIELSSNPQHGWIDHSFILPDLTGFDAIGIQPGEQVQIYQYYPSGNTTAKLESLTPFNKTDITLLGGFSTINAVLGLVNERSGDNIFRQGENATAILYAESGGTDVENVAISYELRYKSDDSVIANNTLGMHYTTIDPSSGSFDTITDVNGELELILNTSYPGTPEDDYYFYITASFAGTGYYTENYDGSNPSTNVAYATVNFTVLNEMDIVAIQYIGATNQPLSPPNTNVTIVTFRVEAQYAYGGTYYPANIPVNATFYKPPTGGVTLSIANGFSNNGSLYWALTDANGYVAFNITAEFPILYLDVVQNIQAVANLQNNRDPINGYPIGPPYQPHRFMRNSGGEVNASRSQTISINPDFWVGEISFNSANVTSVRPGEGVLLEYKVGDSDHPGVNFVNVPVKVTLNSAIAGVSLQFNIARNPSFGAGYYFTDSFGLIEITVSTTYLLTPEIVQNIVLDFVVDFENDSEVRWIGDEHAGTDTLAEFNESWLTAQLSYLGINPAFTLCDIIYQSSNESGDLTIRSGDGIVLEYKVQTAGGTALSNVPVNVTFTGAHQGASITIQNHGGNPRPNYYFTNGSGMISIIISTTYGTTPNTISLGLKATADFENDSQSVWYIGRIPSSGNFRSNYSYSEVQNTVEVNPQYFVGDIYIPTPNNPNSTLIQQNETMEIEFRLKLSYQGVDLAPASLIDSINVFIEINNSAPAVWGMTVTPATTQSSISSSVTFSIKTSQTTTEAVYFVRARADYDTDIGLMYNITHTTVPSGQLDGLWVNGKSAGNYSYATQYFTVQNIDRIRTQIESISDASHTDEGLNVTSGYYEVYRGTTQITVNGTYQDATKEAVTDRLLTISINTSASPIPINLTTTQTDNTYGIFSVTVTLPTNTPLEDITIYARDYYLRSPQEKRIGVSTIRVMTEVNLDYQISGYTGNFAFIGAEIKGNGTLTDDQGQLITSTELNNRLRIVGWDGSQEIGTPSVGSPDGNGIYTLYYSIPQSYAGSTLYIRLNLTNSINLLHYRANYDQILINVYNDIQITSLQMDLPYNSSSFGLTNNSQYRVTGVSHRDVYISGTLKDGIGRNLPYKTATHYWNATMAEGPTSSIGYFSFSYTFTGWTNTSWIWTFNHRLDNGTILSKLYTITILWEVYDTTGPTFIITNPETLSTTGVIPPLTTTRIYVNISDPNPTTGGGYVSVGVDNSSVQIFIDDVPGVMTQVPLTNQFYYDWDTSSPTDFIHNITIVALDMARNEGTTGTIDVVIDIILPAAVIELDILNTYTRVDPNGSIIIEGWIYDNNSITGMNSGINSTEISLNIEFLNGTEILNVSDDEITFIGEYFRYDWNIFSPITDEPIYPYYNFDQWVINLAFQDIAGNKNQTSQIVRLDVVNPTIIFLEQPVANANETVSVNVSVQDLGIGINPDSIVFYLYQDGALIETISSSEYINSGTTYRVTLDVTTRTPGSGYYFEISIRDFSLNVESGISNEFNIIDTTPTTTTTTTTTTTSGPPGGGFGFVSLIEFIVFDLLALAGGIGLAVLYERYKKTRKG